MYRDTEQIPGQYYYQDMDTDNIKTRPISGHGQFQDTASIRNIYLKYTVIYIYINTIIQLYRIVGNFRRCNFSYSPHKTG